MWKASKSFHSTIGLHQAGAALIIVTVPQKQKSDSIYFSRVINKPHWLVAKQQSIVRSFSIRIHFGNDAKTLGHTVEEK
jgi:hypothetical protein